MRPPLDCDARAGRHDRRAAVPARAAVGERAGGRQVSIIQRDRPLLVEFWDFCRPNSMRTLPYLKAWHERYADRRAAGGRGALPGLRALARGGRGARGRGAAGDRVPGADRQRVCCCGRSTRTRAGRRATCSTAARGCSSTTTARAHTRETELRDPGARWASSASRSRRCAPRTRRARCWRRRPRTSRAPTAGPTRRAVCGRCSRAKATLEVHAAP